jgi:hypothetical protein
VGAISQGTLERYAAARASGARLVVVSGARTPTLLQRLPFIPAADAYVSENGGRIFYPDEVAKELGEELIASTARDEEEGGGGENQEGPATTTPLPVACPLVEDLAWRAQLRPVCGPASEEGKGVPPEKRTGSLWAFYRRLEGSGWRVDAQGYSTAFRVQGRTAGGDDDKAAAEAALRAVAASRPSGVACSTNLGVLDFYPARSGKEGAAKRLERLFAAAAAAGGGAGATTPPVRTAFLCDDDNDLALASRVGRVFVPTFGSTSMESAVRAEQRRAAEAGVAAHFVTPAEEVLDQAKGKSAAARCAAATEAMVEAAGAWLDGQEETCEAAATKGGEAVVAAR